jgi:hypothetical protein
MDSCEADQEQIYFYRVTDKYGEFSNFYKAEIEVDGVKYPTTEHYFQAMKFYPNQENVIFKFDSLDGGSAAGQDSHGKQEDSQRR